MLKRAGGTPAVPGGRGTAWRRGNCFGLNAFRLLARPRNARRFGGATLHTRLSHANTIARLIESRIPRQAMMAESQPRSIREEADRLRLFALQATTELGKGIAEALGQ